MLRRFALVAICFGFLTHSAVADNRVVFPTVKALTLNAGGATPPAYVTVSCYYVGTVCSGGGDFDVGLACGAGNNATEIVDASSNCYYRKNFGVNGIVDARQCGVVGDGLPSKIIPFHPDDATLFNICIGIASDAGYHIVSTGGGVILDNTADITVPDNITLTCGGAGASSAANNDYRISSGLSKAIVLDPTNTNATGKPLTVRLTGMNSAFTGCTVVAGAGPQNGDGSYPNPYSPSIWYPDCKPDSTTVPCTTDTPSAKTYLRSAVLEASAFNPNPTAQYNSSAYCGSTAPYHCGPASQSVGVTIDGASHASVHDIAVLGFGTCFKIRARDVGLDNCSGDCWRGVDALTADIPRIRDCTNGPLLTPNTRDTGTAAP